MFLTDLDLINIKKELARRRLIKFIQYTKPDYQTGWFHEEICGKLEKFFQDIKDKKSPKLMIFAPPRHGKSEIVSRRFPAWALGVDPDLEIISCSYSSDLSMRLNRDVQRIIDDKSYGELFPNTSLFGKNIRTVTHVNYLRNSDIFEIVNHKGVFRAAGVGQGITGSGCHLLIIDDPIKDAKEANSPTIQLATYEWWQTTAFTRIAPGGGAIVMMTRWNENDLAGKILEEAKAGEWEIIKYPAIALDDEPLRKEGEALHPERFPVDKLLDIKRVVGSHAWSALYDQNPTPRGGGMIKAEKFEIGTPPKMKREVRSWDKAGTQDGGAFTAGVKIGIDDQGRYWVLDVRRSQLGALRREQMIKQTAELDGPRVKIYIEQEPGSGGKESAEATVRMLAGYRAYADRVTGDKVTRAEPFAAQVESGNIFLAKSEWNKDFIDECAMFPVGKYKDQVDAAAGAFVKLTGVRSLDYSALGKK